MPGPAEEPYEIFQNCLPWAMKRLYSMTHVGIVDCPTDINSPVLSGCVCMTAELLQEVSYVMELVQPRGKKLQVLDITWDELSGYTCVELVTVTVAKYGCDQGDFEVVHKGYLMKQSTWPRPNSRLWTFFEIDRGLIPWAHPKEL